MMDAKGRELQVGDLVLIPARVIKSHGALFVSVETIKGNRPITIVADVVYRANHDDFETKTEMFHVS